MQNRSNSVGPGVARVVRSVLFLALLTASATAAAQPANDTCAGAIALTPSSFPWTSRAFDLSAATTTGDPGFSCQTSSSRRVWFTFTPPVTGSYRIATCGENGTLTDSVIAIHTGACGATSEASCDDDSCTTPSLNSMVTATLTAATTYYVLVGAFGTTASGTFQLTIEANPTNDSCTNATPLTTNTPAFGSTALATANNSLAGTAGPYSGIGHTTTATAPGLDVVYSYTAPAAGNYSFRYTPLLSWSASNPVIYLSDTASCTANPNGTPATVLAASNRPTGNAAEEIHCFPMTLGQTVYAFVDENSATVTGNPFELEVFPCVRENEASTGTGLNDTTSSAQAPVCGIAGSIPAGDFDTYSLGAPAAGSRAFALVDGYAANNTNFDMRITSTDMLPLEYDDSANDTRFGATSPNIAGTPLSGSDTFIRINQNVSTSASEPYRLYYHVQPPAAPTPELEPNDTLGSASGGASNFFSGTLPLQPDGGATVDVDVYAFEARVGQIVHVAVDGAPGRTAAQLQPAVELLDSSGTVVLATNDTGTISSITAATTPTSTSPNSLAESLVYRIRADGIYFVRVLRGTSTLSLASGPYHLSIGVNCQVGVGGYPAPGSATGFTPTTGSSLGGTVITVTGTGFLPSARVRVGGNFAQSTTFISDTQLQAVTPPGTPGNAAVEVVHPGNQAVTAPGTFLYISPPTVATINPDAGTTLGGTAFVITGSEFVGTPITVRFGADAPASFSVDSPTQISGTTAPHAAGTFGVTVTTPYGSSTLANGFTFIPPPNVTSVSPPSGSTLGGNTVTLNGSGFTSSTEIKVDGVVVPQNATGTAAQIFFTAPPHAAGAVSIQVTNPDGQTQTIPNAYTYIAPPDVVSINPTSGATTGNEVVTLTGSNFDANATVTFDTDPATNVTVSNGGTTITATTPGHAAGVVTVTVRNADGQTDTVTFEYIALLQPPTVTSINPTSGTTYGGTLVTIQGTNFVDGGTVSFDGVAATNVTVDSPVQITATTPAHTFGPADVVVTNPDNQFGQLDAGFTFIAPPPTLSATPITPSSGRTTTTTNITITGDEFLAGASVDLGGQACTNVVRVSKTTLTCTAQPRAAGFVSVTVTNPDGKAVTAANAFEYVPAPTVVGPLNPNSGPTAGGTTVVITGTGFRSGANVRFGTTPATFVSVDSATQLTVTSPPGGAGTVSVTITNPDNQSATLSGAFTYFAPPTVTGISPQQGYAVGGTVVTIAGTAFRAGATVRFVVNGASQTATNVTVSSATSITATTPAHTPGLADVIVTNVDAQTFTLTNAFRFVPAPTATAITPTRGPATGGTRVTVTGANFAPGAIIRLGGTPAVGTTVSANGQTISATTAAHAPGLVSVEITNPDGQKVTLTDAFTYDPAPTLTSVAPTAGSTAGGTAVTLTGTGFLTGATVRFGTTAATVSSVTATTITATTPAHAAGTVGVTVTNTDGQSASLPASFTFVDAPTLASLTPATGPTTGGTRVTLTGTSFTTGSTVSFGGTAAPTVTVLSPTSIEVLTPAHAAGPVDVVVRTADGRTATLTNGFTYQPVAPTVDTVAPSSGTSAGGTTVTISGTNFAANATVTFGTTPSPSVVVVSSSLIRAVTPAHAPGVVSLVVANPDGQQGVLSSGFTFFEAASPTEGRVTDGGTGGVTGEQPPDVIRPTPACGCSAGVSPVFGLFALGALMLIRRRRS